eukprot:scaffold33662_cov148-Skeletonema_dohrnii-CCMP3373.AAC.1
MMMMKRVRSTIATLPTGALGGKSEVPEPDLVVRRETCQAWELHSRLEVHEFVCPFYNMAGAQCGCENEPAPDACGPLCGGASLPDPKKEVYGQTCDATVLITSASVRLQNALFVTTHDLVTSRKKIVTALQCWSHNG